MGGDGDTVDEAHPLVTCCAQQNREGADLNIKICPDTGVDTPSVFCTLPGHSSSGNEISLLGPSSSGNEIGPEDIAPRVFRELDRQLEDHRRSIELLVVNLQKSFRGVIEVELQKHVKAAGSPSGVSALSEPARGSLLPLVPEQDVKVPAPARPSLEQSRSTTLDYLASPPDAASGSTEDKEWQQWETLPTVLSVKTEKESAAEPTASAVVASAIVAEACASAATGRPQPMESPKAGGESSLDFADAQRESQTSFADGQMFMAVQSLRRSGTAVMMQEYEQTRWKSLSDTISHSQSNKWKNSLLRHLFHHATGKHLGRWEMLRTEPDNCFVKLIKSWGFSSAISFLILANALFIGYQSEASVRMALKKPPQDDSAIFVTISRVFALIFLSELIFRIFAFRGYFLRGPDCKWNVFDSLLVLSSAVEELLGVLNLTIFRTLRVLRMVRVLRVIRVLRFFRELRVMVCSILHTLSSLAWALILLLLIMYLFSIIFMQAAAGYMREQRDNPVVDKLAYWYTSIFGTMYSLFMSISGGQDWYEIQEPLRAISWVYGLFFALYVFFVAFGVLNVLMAVFVERASESGKLDKDLMTHAEHKQTTAFLEEMGEMFWDIDTEKLGFITREQLAKYVQDENIKAYLKTRNLDSAVHRLFQVMTNNGEPKETLTAEEFMSGMMRLKGNANNADIVMLLYDFQQIYKKVSSLLKEVKILMGESHDGVSRETPKQRGLSAYSVTTIDSISPTARSSAVQRHNPDKWSL